MARGLKPARAVVRQEARFAGQASTSISLISAKSDVSSALGAIRIAIVGLIVYLVIRIVSPDIRLDETLRRHIATAYGCGAPTRCALIRVDEQRLALINGGAGPSMVSMRIIDLDRVSHSAGKPVPPPTETDPVALVEDLANASVELRDVNRRQVYVDGKPVGVPFE